MGIFKFFKMNMMKTKEDVNELIELLKHGKGSSIRINAAKALGKIGDKKAVIPLIKTLDEEYFSFKEVPDYKILKEAVYALGKIGDTRAIERLNDIVNKTRGAIKSIEEIHALSGYDRLVDEFYNFKGKRKKNIDLLKVAEWAIKEINRKK